MLSVCACPYAGASSVVTISTFGLPEGCRFDGPCLEKIFEAIHSPPIIMSAKTAIVLTRLLRRCGSFDARGLKGGGFDVLRGGYAKDIMSGGAQSAAGGLLSIGSLRSQSCLQAAPYVRGAASASILDSWKLVGSCGHSAEVATPFGMLWCRTHEASRKMPLRQSLGVEALRRPVVGRCCEKLNGQRVWPSGLNDVATPEGGAS
jgi:hypothetical protein